MVLAMKPVWLGAFLALRDSIPVSKDSSEEGGRRGEPKRLCEQRRISESVQVLICDQIHSDGKGKMVRPRLSSRKCFL
jgi:hypothetical protein